MPAGAMDRHSAGGPATIAIAWIAGEGVKRPMAIAIAVRPIAITGGVRPIAISRIAVAAVAVAWIAGAPVGVIRPSAVGSSSVNCAAV